MTAAKGSSTSIPLFCAAFIYDYSQFLTLASHVILTSNNPYEFNATTRARNPSHGTENGNRNGVSTKQRKDLSLVSIKRTWITLLWNSLYCHMNFYASTNPLYYFYSHLYQLNLTDRDYGIVSLLQCIIMCCLRLFF